MMAKSFTATSPEGTGLPRRRVLLVSYHFPPVGGAGVQRAAKLVKYLRRYGWDATVLAASNPSVPVLDHSLLADVPSDMLVARARTWEPGYAFKQSLTTAAPAAGAAAGAGTSAASARLRSALRALAGLALQPDPQILWAPSGLQAGALLLELLPHNAIMATGPSYSNLLLGAWLKELSGLPLLLDFRDEWDLSARYLENHARDRFSRSIQGRMQRWVLRRADAIVATTRASARSLADNAREAGSGAIVSCVYNGFDRTDLERLAASPDIPPPAEGAFRLVYTGTLWNLADVRPLVEAVEILAARDPRALACLDLALVGRKTPEQQALVERLARRPCKLHVQGYCEHAGALAWMASADALCVLLSEGQGAERVVPAKLFEYMAMRKEILAVLPDGEAADLVRWCGAGANYLPSDTAGIARCLADRLAGARVTPSATASIDRFSREVLCGQVAALLDRISAGRAGARPARDDGPDLTPDSAPADSSSPAN